MSKFISKTEINLFQKNGLLIICFTFVLLHKVKKIISVLLTLCIVLQVALLSVVTYIYVNHNDVLTASCCVNKGTDDSCRGRCFVTKTTEQEKKDQNVNLKKLAVYFLSSTRKIIPARKTRFDDQKKNNNYTIFYTFLFEKQSLRPPSIA